MIKTHDLVVLMNLLKESFPEIKEFGEDLSVLTGLYFETRYPGGFVETSTWENARQAFEISQKIKKFVIKAVGL